MSSGEFLSRVHVVAEQASQILTKIPTMSRVFTSVQLQTMYKVAAQLHDLGDDARTQLGKSASAPATEPVSTYTGYACCVCGQPQFTTPSGDCCESNHGGAEPSSVQCFADLAGLPYKAGAVPPQQPRLDSINCDGRKYTFVEESTGGFRIDRHGEPWVSRKELINVPGTNAFLALFFKAVELERRNAELEKLLENKQVPLWP